MTQWKYQACIRNLEIANYQQKTIIHFTYQQRLSPLTLNANFIRIVAFIMLSCVGVNMVISRQFGPEYIATVELLTCDVGCEFDSRPYLSSVGL